MTRLSQLAFVLALVWMAACAAPQTEEQTLPPSVPAAVPPITIVAISDFHGALEAYTEVDGAGDAWTHGGAALMSAYVEAIRAQAPGPVLVLDGGDMFQGTLVSNSRQGMPVVTFYNALGVSAAALGNHEFDFGPSSPERTVPLEPEDDPHGALRDIIAAAEFPILAANVFSEEDGSRPDWAVPSAMIEADGLRIGIVGAATPSTPQTTIPVNVEGLRFDDPGASVAAEAQRLRDAGADAVILVAHMGAGCRDFSDPDDLSSCRDHELFALLEGLSEGTLLAAVGGHTHQGVAHRVAGVVALQAFAQGRSIAWAEIPLDGGEAVIHRPVRLCGQVLPEGAPGAGGCDPRQVEAWDGGLEVPTFLGREIVADPRIEALLAPEFERVAALRDELLGLHIEEEITRAYREESAMGNWVVDRMHEAFVAHEPVDVVVVNAGGVRENFQPGQLTYGGLFSVIPFDNRFAVVELSGEELQRVVHHGVTSGRSALLYAGLRYQSEGCEVVSIEVGGAPLDPAGTYRLVTNDYLGSGGSGFNTLGIEMDRFETRWDLPAVRDAIASLLRDGSRTLRSADVFDVEARRLDQRGACAQQE